MPLRSKHPLLSASALVAALCVLVLAVIGASPTLHAGLHDGEDKAHSVPAGEAEHACAVTLFANGLLALALFCLLLLLAPLARDGVVRVVDEIAAAEPRYRLLPAQAPPAA